MAGQGVEPWPPPLLPLVLASLIFITLLPCLVLSGLPCVPIDRGGWMQ